MDNNSQLSQKYTKKSLKRNLFWIVLLIIGTIYVLARNSRATEFQKDNGLIFGTVYGITYQYDRDIKEEIDSLLHRFDNSLSTFNKQSTISLINSNRSMSTDSFFVNVFKRSMEISQATDGAFDITVAPLVNAWGFGFKKGKFPDKAMVDSLMQITGFHKVHLSENKEVVKDDPRIMLDCSAVAKGYAVDVVAGYLRSLGISNFMVDIGGEVVVSGTNLERQNWKIGINRPIDDSLSVNEELQTILSITDKAMATSGNYRNYYYKDGKKYAHTIDPGTGYPVQHNILSATVIAKDCMTADALATSFMVMGLEKAEAFLSKHPEVDVYFILTDADGKYQTYQSKGMSRYILQK